MFHVGLSTEEAIDFTEKIIEYYKTNARPHQRLGAMIEKMDFDKLKSAVLDKQTTMIHLYARDKSGEKIETV